ncbi:DUF2291 family protein [Streptomyces sp. NPDC091294]|uniref:DUF2291 family protein n=1 Tax=Streptomyces sp. NPDC091294 TaxID=3365992 RepID=UPI00382FE402
MTEAPTTLPERGGTGRRSPLTPRRASLAALLLLVVAIAATTTYRSDSEPTASGKAPFDAQAYAAKTYAPKVVPAIKKNAVDITTLHKAITVDPDAAAAKYGHRAGTGPASYAVTLTGVAGTADGGLLPVKVDGLDTARVSVQIGPAINGTALRDAPGLITFGQFTNQVEYADAATALNAQMKAKVLKSFDPAAVTGKKITVTGATTPLTADVVTVTPVSIEVTP